MTIARIKHTGLALPLANITYVLFSTASPSAGVVGSAPMGNFGPMMGFHTYHFDMKNSHSCTIKGYKSDDRGANWVQFYDSGALAAPTATVSNSAVVLIEGLADFKFEVANGGTTQTTFEYDQDLSTFP